MALLVKKIAEGVFNFCESSDGETYDGEIRGGNDVKLSRFNDTLRVTVEGQKKDYPVSQIGYDDGSTIIGFATMDDVITTLKAAGFTGNFNSGGATPQNIYTAVFSLSLESTKYSQSYLGGDFNDFTFSSLFFEDGTGVYKSDIVNSLDGTYQLISFTLTKLQDTASSTTKIVTSASVSVGSLNIGSLSVFD